MSETKKKTAAPKPVSKKPYLTGTPLDSSCIGGALRFFLYLLMMAIAFLFLGAVLSFDSFTLRLIINLAVVLLLLTVMFQSGAAAGSVAVNAGELAYQRKESSRMLNDAEIRSTAVILLILAFGGIMSKGYDQILNMTNAVVRDAAETIDTYIYRITFQEKPKYGFSTAIGLSKSVINFAFLLLANKLAKALGEGGIM